MLLDKQVGTAVHTMGAMYVAAAAQMSRGWCSAPPALVPVVPGKQSHDQLRHTHLRTLQTSWAWPPAQVLTVAEMIAQASPGLPSNQDSAPDIAPEVNRWDLIQRGQD